MKKTSTGVIIIGVVVVVAIVFGLVRWWQNSSEKYNQFAECISLKNAEIAGVDWCPHCQEQKKMFGDSFKYVIYNNCDLMKAWCDEHDVKQYPTWFINNKRQSPGVKSMEELSRLTGCPLP